MTIKFNNQTTYFYVPRAFGARPAKMPSGAPISKSVRKQLGGQG